MVVAQSKVTYIYVDTQEIWPQPCQFTVGLKEQKIPARRSDGSVRCFLERNPLKITDISDFVLKGPWVVACCWEGIVEWQPTVADCDAGEIGGIFVVIDQPVFPINDREADQFVRPLEWRPSGAGRGLVFGVESSSPIVARNRQAGKFDETLR